MEFSNNAVMLTFTDTSFLSFKRNLELLDVAPPCLTRVAL